MLILLACGQEPVETVDTDDTAPVAPIDAALAAMPSCVPGADDGALDIAAGCAGDVCLGSLWPDVREALGKPQLCTFIVDGTVCSWSSGLVASFADGDGDGTPDDEATAYTISINRPWDGGTTDGLALDASLRCFVDVLGDPDAIGFGRYGDEWLVRSMIWNELYFSVYDFQGEDGVGAPDDEPDFVQLQNYLYY